MQTWMQKHVTIQRTEVVTANLNFNANFKRRLKYVQKQETRPWRLHAPCMHR